MYSDDYYAGDAPRNVARQQQHSRPNQQQLYAGDNQGLDEGESPSSASSTNFAANGAARRGVSSNFNEMELIDRVQTQLELDGRQEHARQFSDHYRSLMKDPSFSNRQDLLETFQRAFRSEGDMSQQQHGQYDEDFYEEIPATNARQASNFPRPPLYSSASAVRPPRLTNRRGGGMTLPHRMPHSATTGNVYSVANGADHHSASNLPAATGMPPPRYPPISATSRNGHYGQAGAMPSSSSSSAASAGANMRFGLRLPPPSIDYAPRALVNNTMPRHPMSAGGRGGGMMPSMSFQHLPNPSSAGLPAALNPTLPRSTSHAQFGQILSPHIEEEHDDTVSDWDLIKDLVKVCNGINGQYIVLGDHKCELYAHVRINPAHSQIGLKIAEVGWLTNQIRTFIDRRRDRGYVKEGLYVGIQERLASLEGDIVALDSQLHVEDQEGFPVWERLTLSRLYALMIEPIKRLNVMFTVARHVDTMKGGEIVNYLYTQADEGDRDKRSTAIGLLSACVKPVFFMISHWLYHGQVRDECAEFFIRSIAPERRSPATADSSFNSGNNSFNASSNDTLPNSFILPPDADLKQPQQPHRQSGPLASWYEQFILVDEQIPKFISPAMAHKIFIAGQTTCFLRTFCGERAIPDFDKEIMPLLLEISSSPTTTDLSAGEQKTEQEKHNNMSASTATYSHLSQLWNPNTLRLDLRANAIFNRMHSIASRALMDTLNTEFHLSWHIEAIVNYMLHKRGDFVVELIELLRDDLERDAGTFTASSDIHGAVRLAVEQSSARTDPEEVLANLSGDFDKKVSNSDVGWDLFSIRYRLDDVGPLQIIFTPDIMLRLRKMWRFIWRVKRANYLLTKLWWNAQTVFGKQPHSKRRLASASSKGSRNSEPVNDTACHVMLERLMVTEMLHFVQQLEHYICFEVVAVSHAQLLEALGRATELKDLILAVETFVTHLEERLFLKSFDETISVRVRSILTCVNAVQRCHESLVSLVTPHADLMDHSINFGQQRQQLHFPDDNAGDTVWIVYDQLRQTYLKFQTLLCEFLHGLLVSSDDNMQALHFRLDYSHYYERLQNSYGNDLLAYIDIPLDRLSAAAQPPQQE